MKAIYANEVAHEKTLSGSLHREGESMKRSTSMRQLSQRNPHVRSWVCVSHFTHKYLIPSPNLLAYNLFKSIL